MGSLRNISIALCDGDLFVQWDDDDFNSPERLSIQFNVLLKNNKAKICYFGDQLHYYFEKNMLFWENWDMYCSWGNMQYCLIPGTIMAWKHKFDHRYPSAGSFCKCSDRRCARQSSDVDGPRTAFDCGICRCCRCSRCKDGPGWHICRAACRHEPCRHSQSRARIERSPPRSRCHWQRRRGAGAASVAASRSAAAPFGASAGSAAGSARARAPASMPPASSWPTYAAAAAAGAPAAAAIARAQALPFPRALGKAS